MSTADEIEAKILATQDHLTKRIDAMTAKVDIMMQRYAAEAAHTVFKDNIKYKLATDQAVNGFAWEYVTTVTPRECLTSGKTILPLTKAYKGTENIDEVLMPNGVPEILWMTKEEFTMYRLKGLL